ncbi:MAG TPA: hypothetical protein VIP52_11620 [Candidatus Dormibacteraeota bacterium]
MTKGLRWRFITLMAALVIILGGASAFLINEGNFVNSTVHDQLAAQQIFFPAATTEVPGGALDPAEFPDLQQYAGQQVDNGTKAKAYAEGFLGRHLDKVANGKKYAQIDTKSGTAAENATATAQKTTLFQGETLKNMLLNAWGWSMLATYTTYGGYALLIAALVVLVALVYELFFATKPEEVVVAKPKASGSPVTA